MTDLSKMTPEDAYWHARWVRKAPWPEAEPLIMSNPYWACHYARYIKEAPWPEAEPVIMSDPEVACEYLCHVSKKWPILDDSTLNSDDWARASEIYRYAQYRLGFSPSDTGTKE